MSLPIEQLQEIADTFEEKVNAAIIDYIADGVTYAPKEDPLDEGHPIYTRNYSYSVMNALLCVFFTERESEYERVTQEWIANCQMYIDSKALRDDFDSFYWSACLLCAAIELFGQAGSRTPGLLSVEAEQIAYEMMWAWAYDNSVLADAEIQVTQTWYVWNSENHHIQKFSTAWHFLKLLLKQDDYRELIHADGNSITTHFTAWNEYCKAWIRERGRRGLFVESGTSNYTHETLKGVCNFLEYGEDEELRTLAGQLLQLFWASWAMEQLNGVRGGGKSRAYPNLHLTGADSMYRLSWYYFGIGTAHRLVGADLAHLTSSFRMPQLIIRLALEKEERGNYEVKNRVMGLAKDGHYQPLDYRLADEGGVLRYAYCTPDFIMGSLLVEARPEPDWTMISSQNRWQGIIFPDEVDARIHIQCEANREDYGANRPESIGGIMRSYNQHWTVQSKGSMITQKLQTSLGAKAMQVWYSASSLTRGIIHQNGWVFAETERAYCGLHVVNGGHTWKDMDGYVAGRWLVLENEWSPIIVEVAGKQQFDSREAFMEACFANELSVVDGVVRYHSLYGDNLTFYSDYSQIYEINDVPVDIYNDFAFDSPYVMENWKSGNVTIQYHGETITQQY